MGGLVGLLIIEGMSIPTKYTDKTLMYAINKYLGCIAGNGYMSTLLIAEIPSETPYPNIGLNGRIYLSRGSKGYALVSISINVECIISYTNAKFTHSVSGYKCGRCTYNGKTYIAFQVYDGPICDIYFTGYYTRGCMFLHVLDSEVQWQN